MLVQTNHKVQQARPRTPNAYNSLLFLPVVRDKLERCTALKLKLELPAVRSARQHAHVCTGPRARAHTHAQPNPSSRPHLPQGLAHLGDTQVQLVRRLISQARRDDGSTRNVLHAARTCAHARTAPCQACVRAYMLEAGCMHACISQLASCTGLWTAVCSPGRARDPGSCARQETAGTTLHHAP